MGEIFSQLFAKIVAVVTWFSDLFVAIFVALVDLLRDLVCWCLEEVMKIAVAAVSALDVSGLNGYVASVGSLPGEILNILGLLGVGLAISIIGGAILLRFGLQLIPFVRLGS